MKILSEDHMKQNNINLKNRKILALITYGLPDSPLSKYDVFLDSAVSWNPDARVIGPLKEVFGEVLSYDFGTSYSKKGIKECNRELIEIVKKETPDILFWASMNYEIMPETFDIIREMGCIVGGWFFDDEIRFSEYSKWISRSLDFVFTNDMISVAEYEKDGTYSEWLPVTSNQNYFPKYSGSMDIDVSFIGRCFGDRAVFLKYIMNHGIKVETFGKGWENGYIPFDKVPLTYGRSKISFCLTKSYGLNTRPQIKDKIFDICSTGSMLMCEYVPGIEKLFEIDKEIVCFRTFEEAVQKLEYYLNNPDKRTSIAKAGHEKFINFYTQDKVFTKGFSDMIRSSVHKSEYKNSISEWPYDARKKASIYHLNWGLKLFEENYPTDRWIDESERALLYCDDNKVALTLQDIALLPQKDRDESNIKLRKSEYSWLIKQKKDKALSKFENLTGILEEIYMEMAELDLRNIALYGAGRHTSYLLQLDLFPFEITVICDDNACDEIFLGIPLRGPDNIKHENFDGVILSSDAYEDELASKIDNWVPKGVPVWRMYCDGNKRIR